MRPKIDPSRTFYSIFLSVYTIFQKSMEHFFDKESIDVLSNVQVTIEK